MRPMKTFEIIKPGTFTASNGQTFTFTAADLRQSAEAYNADLSEAPIVVGHPKTNAPAYGWINDLSLTEDEDNVTLNANPKDIDADFAELVEAGRFKKRSASFYHPGDSNNPVPGVYYLRHVGFLGAQAPAVKGLKDVAFADDDHSICIEFSESALPLGLGRILRSLREWLIDKEDIDTANQIIPAWSVEDVEAATRIDASAPALSESPSIESNSENTMSDNDPSIEFAEREKAINAREQALAEKEKAIARHDDIEFCETLISAGKLLPKDKNGLVELMTSLDTETSIEFSEGDSTVKYPCKQWLKAFLNTLPKSVEFNERAAAADSDIAIANFSAPNGYTVDNDKLRIHNKALAYQNEHDVDYVSAVNAVKTS